jgi:hypothetical protein
VCKQLIKEKAANGEKVVDDLIDRRLTDIVCGLLFNTRSMNFADRNYVLGSCILNFKRYISIKGLFLAYLPLTRFRGPRVKKLFALVNWF